LIDRIGDKNWKTRLQVYDDLRKELTLTGDNPNPNPIFADYGPWLSKMTADSNAGALDSGLETAILFVDLAPTNCVCQFQDRVFANVVDKAFGTRALTLAKGKVLLLKLMEVDDATACATFLLTKLLDKKPKVPPTCLDLLKEGVVAFGA
jgi:cytoskeleton-associated protein 5